MPTSNLTLLDICTYNPLTDTYTSVLNLNDRVNWYMKTLDYGTPDLAVARAGTIRVPGQPITKIQAKNRHVTVTLWTQTTNSTPSLLSNLRGLLGIINIASVQATTWYLRIALPGTSTLYSYIGIRVAKATIPNDTMTILAKAINNIAIDFECDPYFRGNLTLLQNLVMNPGFEAPSSSPVTAFNDNLTNLNAYAIQAGGALTNDTFRYPDGVNKDTPRVYYRLDEPSGTTAYDAMNSGNNGTLHGGITLGSTGLLTGDTDTCMTFNGSTGYISLPTTGLSSGNNPYTLECWFNATSFPASSNYTYILSLGTASSGQLTSLALYNYSGTTYLGCITIGGDVIGVTPLSTSTTYHAAVTWDGTTLRLYLNGSQNNSATPGARNLTFGNAYIGARVDGTSFFTGRIKDPQIYTTALSAERIAAHYVAGTVSPASSIYASYILNDALGAPIRYYRSGEASGTTAYDLTGTGYNGTYSGSGVTYGVPGALSGDSNTAVTFDGSAGKCTFPTTGLPSGANAWSVSAWIKVASLPTGGNPRVIMCMGNWSIAHQCVVLGLDNVDGGVYISTAGTYTDDSSALSTNTWHYVVGTYDGAYLRCYLDGVLVGGPTAEPNANITLNGAAIGAAYNGAAGTFLAGTIDEATMYNYALSPTQIALCYALAMTTPTSYPNTMTIPAAGRVAFGSPAWNGFANWQIRFRWVTGLTATFYPMYQDASNFVSITVTQTSIVFGYTISGTPIPLYTGSINLVNGMQYWLKSLVNPGLAGLGKAPTPAGQVWLYVDSAGSPSTQIVTSGSQGIFPFTARPQIAASGAALGIGGNYSNVNLVQLFGPGGWGANLFGSTSAVATAWDSNTSNAYTGGPVTSRYVARIDFSPTGSSGATFYTCLASTDLGIIPANAGDVLQFVVPYKYSNVSASCNVFIGIAPFQSNGTPLTPSLNTISISGTAGWTTATYTFTAPANTAYVQLIIGATDTASNSGTVWFDNVQCWNQTTTGATSMPYCELGFSQTPAQLMVSGLVGDISAPALIALATYPSPTAAYSSATALLGRCATSHKDRRLVGLTTTNQSILDSTVYGGIQSDNSSYFDMLENQGTFHLFQKVKVHGVASPTGLTVTPQWFEVARSGLFTGYTSPYASYNYGIAANDVWTTADLGQIIVPISRPGSLANLAYRSGSLYIQTQTSSSSLGGGTIAYGGHSLMPVDGDFETVTFNLANTTLAGTNWLVMYLDGLNATATYTLEYSSGGAIQSINPADAVTGPGSSLSLSVYVTSGGDPVPMIDPTVSTSLASGVNQWVAALYNSGGTILPVMAYLYYYPLYLTPR